MTTNPTARRPSYICTRRLPLLSKKSSAYGAHSSTTERRQHNWSSMRLRSYSIRGRKAMVIARGQIYGVSDTGRFFTIKAVSMRCVTFPSRLVFLINTQGTGYVNTTIRVNMPATRRWQSTALPSQEVQSASVGSSNTETAKDDSRSIFKTLFTPLDHPLRPPKSATLTDGSPAHKRSRRMIKKNPVAVLGVRKMRTGKGEARPRRHRRTGRRYMCIVNTPQVSYCTVVHIRK